jgi:small-conductance mechanosensitive channel
MSETSPSQLTQIVNRIGRKPFAAAGGTALWKAIDDVGRRQEEIRSRLATRLDRQAEQAKSDRQRAVASAKRIDELQKQMRAADERIRMLSDTIDGLNIRIDHMEQARPRVVPGRPPQPNPEALERREAALAAPLTSLGKALAQEPSS